jgi:MoxR-like ATPase
MKSLIAKILNEAAPAMASAKPSKTPTSATTTSKAAATTKKIQVGSTNLDSRTTQIEHVIDNMTVAHGTGLLLAGPTGIGKTTFVKQVGRLMGLPVILVEAPHITEEHLINIPFVVFEPTTKSGKASSVAVDPTTYHVQLGQSHLASELAKKRSLNDAALLNEIKSADANVKKLWSNMGGSDVVIPPEIASIRQRYKVILFLDEYFRQTSANVRNILRGILNGRIGNDRIPAGTYVIYASNLSDVGQTIEQIPLNADFKKINYEPPTKDEFLHYLVSRFENHTQVQLKPQVIQAFDKALTDDHISYDDVETEIRTSPRRWEQIILYVNSSVPVKGERDAAALLSNVKSMFQSSEAVSSLHRLVDDVVRSLIVSTSGEQYANVKPLETGDWRSTLQHQIETKIKIGDSRTYVPVVAGMPGIGKTAQAADVAQKMNMLLIHIDCSTLTIDEITGIPIPTQDGHKMSVNFSEPSLYQRIMQEIEEDTEALMNNPNVSEENKQAFASQPYKYLIFFDELNRVKTASVFNSLRRVILEKSFNDQVSLPKDSIVIAAMNPYDKGTVELTGHLKDATDYIDTAPSWSSLISYLENTVVNSAALSARSDQSKSVAMELLTSFADTFAVKKAMPGIGADSRKFYIRMGSDNIYISPREYTTMLMDLVAGADRVISRSVGMEQEEYQQALFRAIWAKLKSTLEWILDKHQVDSPQFLSEVRNWLQQISARFLIKARASASLTDMLNNIINDHTQHLKDDIDFVNYVENFNLNKFSEDFENYLGELVKEEKVAVDSLVSKTHTKKEIKDGKVVLAKELISKIEYVMREILIANKAHDLSADLQDYMYDTMDNFISENFADTLSDAPFNEALVLLDTLFKKEFR